jgi:hypothetical protein
VDNKIEKMALAALEGRRKKDEGNDEKTCLDSSFILQ